jgi:hypothetical protein
MIEARQFAAHIAAELRNLREESAMGRIWGAEIHRFVPNAALREGSVQALEREYGVSLPPEYRAYITRVGDGGAGPWQGLLQLRDAVQQTIAGCPKCLKGEFMHGREWKDENGIPHAWFQFRDPARRGYTPVSLDEGMSPGFMAGSLIITHGKPKNGNSLVYRLVLNGSERGFIWRDDRARSGSVGPCQSGSPFLPRVDFQQWMLTWLEDCRMGHQFSL